MKTNIYKFRFTLAFLVAMLFGAANLQAQTAYNLWICGKQVTDANKGDLTVINGTNDCTVTGIVNYNSTSNTLMLRDATITYLYDRAIKSEIIGLKIELVGTNTVSGAPYSAIHFSNSSGIYNNTIIGNGTLNVSCPTGDAISLWKTALTITGCTVNANGSGGFRGLSSASLTIEDANVTAIGSSKGSISSFDYGITLNGCSFISPANAQIINGNVCYPDSNIITSEVKIGISKYDLWICGTQVTGVNKDDLSVINGVTGTASYNPDNTTLTLNNANITIPDGANAIRSSIDGLKINVQNNNTVNSDEYATMRLEKSTTISGSGTLNVSQTSGGWAVYIYDSSVLTIDSCTVNATSTGRSITGSDVDTLIINNANVMSKGANGSITHFSDIILNGCVISKPVGAIVDDGTDTFYAVRDTLGNIIMDTVKIRPIEYYNLYICGVQVNEINKDDLSVINGVTGTVSYNSDSKILTLNNANITIPDGANAIKSNINGLTVDVQNNNIVNSDGWATMRLEKSTTISGSGTLNVSQTSGGWTVYVCGSSSLTIENCTVNATSSNYRSITGDDNGTLIINNATVTSKGTTGSITHFANIILNGCVISKPIGAVVSKGADTFYAVRDALGNIITDTVKIKPIIYYDLWICGEQVTNLNKDDLSVICVNGTVTGNVSYNPQTQTLHLENADIYSLKAAIETHIDGMRIEVVGTNTVTTADTNKAGIRYYGTLSNIIEGNGSLTINALNYDAILFEGSNALTIKNCTLSATGARCGIGCSTDKNLVIDSAIVSATGAVDGSIIGFNEMNLNDCVFAQPLNAYFDSTQKAVVAADAIVKTQVKILPGTAYKLEICGVQVTSLIKDDLTAINGIDGCIVWGTVNYNPATQTLTLNDANILAGDNAIVCYNGGVNIELIGDNIVSGYNSVIIFHALGEHAPGSIYGNGTLNTTSTDEIAIESNVPLTIKNCTIKARGKDHGISGSGNKLTINDAYVSAIGAYLGSIVGFDDMELINCAIAEPAGAMFDTTKHAICAADTIVKTWVKIMPVYTITYNTPEHGTLVVKQGTNNINNGDEVLIDSEITITATPDNGYKLKTLTVNGNPFESGNTHIVVADVNIVAEFVITGIEELAAQGINIYPNPVQDILYIEAKETVTAVNIYNMLGSIVAQNTGDVREINVSNLPAGIYMVRVEMGESVGMLQIVKK